MFLKHVQTYLQSSNERKIVYLPRKYYSESRWKDTAKYILSKLNPRKRGDENVNDNARCDVC